MELPLVYQELDIAELSVTHVFRDYDHRRVGFVVQGEDKMSPLYVYVSDEQATELSASFAHWLGEENGIDETDSRSAAPGMGYSSGTAEVAAGGS